MQNPRITIYRRGDRVFLTPTIGGLDAEPVFQCVPQPSDLADAIEGALSATPTIDLPEEMVNYRSPVAILLKLKSASAFERGLKTADLNVCDTYEFFRWFPLPKYKSGLIKEDRPLWTLPRATPFRVIAEHILAAFDDPSWTTR